MPDDVTKVAGLPIPSISPFLKPQTKTNSIRSQELGAAAALPADHRDNAWHHGDEADHKLGQRSAEMCPPPFSRRSDVSKTTTCSFSGHLHSRSVLGPHPSPTKREPVGPVSHKNLPLWKELPSVTYWLLPGGIGMPIIVRAVQGTPPVRRADPQDTTLAE